MLTSIATLIILLLLAKLPIDSAFFGSSMLTAYMPPLATSESMPLIMAHEIQSDVPTRPVERFLPNDAFPESDLILANLTKEDIIGESDGSRIAPRQAAAVATLNLRDLVRTAEFMHTAIAAPVVDTPPKLRIGSMLIDYPFSALKRAIEGLVIVRFTVETDGRAYGIDVVSSLEPACDSAVIDAVRDARFVPGQSKGKNVPALAQMVIHFRIEEQSRLY